MSSAFQHHICEICLNLDFFFFDKSLYLSVCVFMTTSRLICLDFIHPHSSERLFQSLFITMESTWFSRGIRKSFICITLRHSLMPLSHSHTHTVQHTHFCSFSISSTRLRYSRGADEWGGEARLKATWDTCIKLAFLLMMLKQQVCGTD